MLSRRSIFGVRMTCAPADCEFRSHALLRSFVTAIALTAFLFGNILASFGDDGSPKPASPVNAPSRSSRLLAHPIWVYNNWSSYDELSDRIPLTEDLAMKELGEIVRLQKTGVHFDFY